MEAAQGRDTQLRRRVAGDGLDHSVSDLPAQGSTQDLILAREPQRGFRWGIARSVVLLVSLSSAFYYWMGAAFEPTIDPLNYTARADRILSTTPLIDGHNDLPYLLRLELQNRIYDRSRFDLWRGVASHTDLKRLRAGRVGGQFWSVYVECPDIQHLDDPNHNVRDTLEQIDVAKRLFAEYSSDMQYCETSACAISAFKSGRIGSMLGAEGLHQAGSAIGVIRQLFNLGVRYITLTHNCNNAFATAASTVTATGIDGGLTEFGVAAIEEMNRLGMMVDLSHTSHRTMRDVLAITRSPVMFSHIACYELAKSYRNAPDDVLARVKDNGGVVMVFFVKRFLNAVEPDKADIHTAVDHIFHVAKIAGWEHVGIGADFDGTVSLANGIDDVSAYPRLIEEVLRRGATDDQVRGLVGANVLRVWRDNEVMAARLQALPGSKPVEDIWTERRWTQWDDALPIMIPGNKDRVRGPKSYV